MYSKSQFVVDDEAELIGFIEKFPLATLVYVGRSAMDSCSLPLQLHREQESLCLRGHVARRNPLWQQARNDIEPLAIFSGPNHYVSPGWYPGKSRDPRVVPTWNYLVVQARGPLRFIDDSEWKLRQITQLTEAHESTQAQPWAISDAPEAFIHTLLGAIVGVELEIKQLEGVFKLSQNQPELLQQQVAAELSELGSPLGDWMPR